MKRLILCATALSLLLGGCALFTAQPETTAVSVPSTTSPMEDALRDEEMLAILEPLVERNILCVQELFFCRALPVNEEKSAEDIPAAFAVQFDRFPTYADLDSYVRSTYVRSIAEDLLLNRPEGEDAPLYFEQDGILYENTNLRPSEAAQVDWEGRTIQILEKSAITCNFTVTARRMEEDAVAQQTVVIDMRAVQVGDVWLLEMMYTGTE